MAVGTVGVDFPLMRAKGSPVSIEDAVTLMRGQHSLITSVQAREVGVGGVQCTRLVRRGYWERVDHGLYGPAGVAMTPLRRLMAAALLGPPGTIASHRSAAHLLGVGGYERLECEVTVPRGSSLRRDWVRVHESTDLALADLVTVQGIQVTGPRRLAMDVGSVMSEDRYRHTMRELRDRYRVTSEDLLRTYLRHRRSGRNGGAALRDWLDRYYDVSGVPESGLEQVVLDSILDAGIPAPTLQRVFETTVGAIRVDLCFEALRIIVEVDGRQHREPEAVARDAARDAALGELGWLVIRVRSWCLASDLMALLTRLRQELRQPATAGVTR